MHPGGSGTKIYTIIGGVNGVGKSSFTGVLKERSTDLGAIIDVDYIAQAILEAVILLWLWVRRIFLLGVVNIYYWLQPHFSLNCSRRRTKSFGVRLCRDARGIIFLEGVLICSGCGASVCAYCA